EVLINYHVTGWCFANVNLVSHYGTSQRCYALSNGDCMNPNSHVILNWNALVNAQKNEPFLPVVPILL
ncbi:16134_t:CDS:2, partial [Rhizophagus irregularis]